MLLGIQVTHSRWNMLTPLCHDAPSHAWCITPIEVSGSKARLRPNQISYLEFLLTLMGMTFGRPMKVIQGPEI